VQTGLEFVASEPGSVGHPRLYFGAQHHLLQLVIQNAESHHHQAGRDVNQHEQPEDVVYGGNLALGSHGQNIVVDVD